MDTGGSHCWFPSTVDSDVSHRGELDARASSLRSFLLCCSLNYSCGRVRTERNPVACSRWGEWALVPTQVESAMTILGPGWRCYSARRLPRHDSFSVGERVCSFAFAWPIRALWCISGCERSWLHRALGWMDLGKRGVVELVRLVCGSARQCSMGWIYGTGIGSLQRRKRYMLG